MLLSTYYLGLVKDKDNEKNNSTDNCGAEHSFMNQGFYSHRNQDNDKNLPSISAFNDEVTQASVSLVS